MFTIRSKAFSRSVLRMHAGLTSQGAAIAIKKDCRNAADAAAAIGEGLQAFCIPGSVADQRKVGLGHGNLGKMLLEESTDCFCFLAGHESFAAAEGAIGIAEKANKVRKKPLRVIPERPWKQMQLRSSPGSTDSHMYRQSTTTSQASSKKFLVQLTLTDSVPKLTATAQTMYARV